MRRVGLIVKPANEAKNRRAQKDTTRDRGGEEQKGTPEQEKEPDGEPEE